MGHQQQPTPVTMDSKAANRIVNGTEKQKIHQAIDMIFYWVRDITQQNHFHILWEEGKKNLADYVTKHHPIWHHRVMIPRYVKEKRHRKLEIPENWDRERVFWNYKSRGNPETG